MESQSSGSCLGWCQPRIDAGWFSGRLGSRLLLEYLPHLPTPTPDLPRPSSLSVGCSQSPKKTKTPPLSKSEKPGKVPCGRSPQAHLGPPWLDSLGDLRLLGDGSLPKEAAHCIHSSIHSSIHSTETYLAPMCQALGTTGRIQTSPCCHGTCVVGRGSADKQNRPSGTGAVRKTKQGDVMDSRT